MFFDAFGQPVSRCGTAVASTGLVLDLSCRSERPRGRHSSVGFQTALKIDRMVVLLKNGRCEQ